SAIMRPCSSADSTTTCSCSSVTWRPSTGSTAWPMLPQPIMTIRPANSTRSGAALLNVLWGMGELLHYSRPPSRMREGWKRAQKPCGSRHALCRAHAAGRSSKTWWRIHSAGGRGRAGEVARGSGASLLRKRDGKLEHFVPVLLLEIDLDGFRIDTDVLADDFQQLTAQQRQIIRTAAIAALLRNDDAQTLLGEAGRLRRAAEECEQTHVQPPKMRDRMPFFGSSMNRSAISSPSSRETASS